MAELNRMNGMAGGNVNGLNGGNMAGLNGGQNAPNVPEAVGSMKEKLPQMYRQDEWVCREGKNDTM